MPNVQVINMENTPHRWMTLMFHFQNSSTGVFELVFPDTKQARTARMRMASVLGSRPGWFRMVILQKDCSIFIIKTCHIKKVQLVNTGL